MSSPSFVRSDIWTVLPLIATQLQQFLGFPPERVVMLREGQSPDEASLQGDMVVMIRPEAENVNRRQIQAAGRHDFRVFRRVSWITWTRLNVDYSGQSYSWLTNPTLGHGQFENAVKNCLATWIVQDGNRNALAIPARIEVNTAPIKARDDWGYASGIQVYEMYLDLNQAPIFSGAQ
jgi:hypothetical protein